MDQKKSTAMTGMVVGIAAAVTYGMNPLFTLPLYGEGFTPDTVLFLRYTAALLLLTVFYLVRHESLRLTEKELLCMIPEGFLFTVASLTLFQSYRFMDSGVASTILFVSPLFTALLMWMIYHEKLHISTMISLVMAAGGIVLLCRKADGGVISWTGFFFALASAITYAMYMVFSDKGPLKNLTSAKLTFYTLALGVILFGARILCGCGQFGHFSTKALVSLLLLAFFPTVLSLMFTNMSIRMVGSTVTSILGAFEPLTAVFFGVLIFHEKMTVRIAAGILLTLAAVSLTVLHKKKAV